MQKELSVTREQAAAAIAALITPPSDGQTVASDTGSVIPFILNDKGQVKQTVENCKLALKLDPEIKDKLRYNELSERIDITGDVSWVRNGITIDDTDRDNIILRLEKMYGLAVDKKIDRAINIVANENRYNPIKEKLESLEWDGTERLKHALHHFLGAEENEMAYESLKIFMLGAVCRIYEPGCKFDTMLCLVGDQGAGKSTFFRFLAMDDDYFCDDIRHLDDDKVFQRLQGHWIIEMPEMLATINAKNVETIKSFLSKQRDNYRVPYDHFAKDRPRRCVFAGTSNKKQFLPSDRSGNRRLIPIEVSSAAAEVHILDDEKTSRAYIEQMWAEIMEIYRSGNFSLKLPKELADSLAEYQEQFTPEDYEAVAIRQFMNGTTAEYVCTRMIYSEAFGHPVTEVPQKWQSVAINEVIEKLPGWKPVKSHRFELYGIQRAWKRESTSDGFITLPAGAETPFDK